MTASNYNILILGASYGSLLGCKFLFGGHRVHLVCRPATAELLNREGFRIRMPVKGQEREVEVHSRSLPGQVSASAPDEVDPAEYDLVCLAMQEPQYRSAGVRELLAEIGRSKVPCLSIMNMPPPPYLKRIRGLNTHVMKSAYADPSVWANFDPSFITLCSPDPQAVRLPGEKPNVLKVTLATNFKAAAFESDAHTSILRRLEREIENIRFEENDRPLELPVKLKVHDSIFTPLAKWPMLLAGNYRCVTSNGPISIREAVHSDIESSRSVYNFVVDVCLRLGASDRDLVPFEKYAAAAESLTRPSSTGRAVAAGAPYIERADRLVQLVAAQHDMRHPILDATVALINERISENRQIAA